MFPLKNENRISRELIESGSTNGSSTSDHIVIRDKRSRASSDRCIKGRKLPDLLPFQRVPSSRAENIDYPMTYLWENYCRGGSIAFITSCFQHGSTRAIYLRAHCINQQKAREKIRSELYSTFSSLLLVSSLSISLAALSVSVYLTSRDTLCRLIPPMHSVRDLEAIHSQFRGTFTKSIRIDCAVSKVAIIGHISL